MKQIKMLAIAVLLTSISNSVLAGQVTPCVPKTVIDYSVASDYYNADCHQNQQWQSLGPWVNSGSDNVSHSEDNYISASRRHSLWGKYNVKGGAAGYVQWRTSSDNGVTWSDYGTDDKITQGDTVEFKFFADDSKTGAHKFSK
jgi:hypothetical protein